jgi:hypothetical protein
MQVCVAIVVIVVESATINLISLFENLSATITLNRLNVKKYSDDHQPGGLPAHDTRWFAVFAACRIKYPHERASQ